MKRHRVTFTGEAASILSELADRRGVSVSEVVRTAINREAWFDAATANGMIYYKADGEDTLHEVEFVD